MSVGQKQNSSTKNGLISYRYQKVGNSLRVGNHNCQYYKDSNGSLIRVSRPIIQKIDNES